MARVGPQRQGGKKHNVLQPVDYFMYIKSGPSSLTFFIISQNISDLGLTI